MRRFEIRLFLIVELCLYILFLALDFTAHFSASIPWKYASILVCFLFSVFSYSRGWKRLLPVALFLTALADIFLLVLDRHYILGILLFCIVQFIYAVYLAKNGGCILMPLRILLPVITVIVLHLANVAAPVNIVSGIYFSQLLVNTATAWKYPKNTGPVFALGLTLFVFCDVCVGIYNMAELFPTAVHDFSRIAMWLFYLPSQVLIVLSGIPPLAKEK